MYIIIINYFLYNFNYILKNEFRLNVTKIRFLVYFNMYIHIIIRFLVYFNIYIHN